MTAPITYSMQVDLDRDGTYSSPLADITRFVKGQISLSYGIQQAYEEVAAPSRMTFTVTNVGSEFDRDRFGGEQVANGNFSIYASGDPSNWTVTNDNGTTRVVEASNGTSGDASFRNGGDNVTLKLAQNIFTAGRIYLLSINVSNTPPVYQSYKHFVPLYVYNGTTLVGILRSEEGMRTFTIRASDPELSFQFLNPDSWDATFTIDDVSVVELPTYRQLEKSTLVRLRTTYLGVTATIWEGKITDFDFLGIGGSAEPAMTITCEDAMLQLLDKEYAPPLETNVTADVVLQNMFDTGLVPYPYPKVYWMLGTPGSSELGLTTYLFSNTVSDGTSLDTGIHVFSYVGDAADRGQGISAQGYIRDLIAAEVGRFFWDVRTSKFIFHNRQHDSLNDASQLKASFVQSDLDTISYTYGEDILNQLTVEFTERTIGAANSTIWSATNVPFVLKYGTPRVITARYFDATTPENKIAAMDFVQIVNGVDVTANTASDGSGTNMSLRVSMTADCGATSAKIYLDNSTGQDVFITSMQLRGTPLTQKSNTFESLDAPSKRSNDEYPKTLQLVLMDDADTVEQYVGYQLARFKNPFTRLASITFTSLRNTTTLDAAMNRIVGDRIGVTLNNGHDADYFIVGENRTINVGGDTPAQVTWILEPAQRKLFWVLGVVGQSEMGTTTILGF